MSQAGGTASELRLPEAGRPGEDARTARLRIAFAVGVLASIALLAVIAWPPGARAFPGLNGKIAFTSSRDGNYEIYTMNLDGTSQVNVSNNSAGDLFPTWSPDGQKIAFTSFRDGGNEDIYVMNADGSGQTRLTNDPAADAKPTWSPDGQKIAFRTDRDGGNYEIYVMDAADGSGQTNLTNDPGLDDSPAWSPDGKKIAFETSRDGNYEIYAMNANGTGQTDLTNDPGADHRPSWSPYTQQIAFDSSRDGDFEIFSMNPNGTGQTQLTSNVNDDTEPTWSADGSKIAFRSQRDGNAEIYTMAANGASQTRLTTNTSFDSHPDWQSAVTGFVRPKSASPTRASLVIAYQPCTSANRTHGPSLAFASCNPPVQASSYLTVGTPDVNGNPANSVGFVRLSAVVGVPGPPDDSDIAISMSLTDVRCKAGVSTCAAGVLSDYTGQVQAGATIRITDKFNGTSPGGGAESATVTDIDYPFTVPCAPTAGAEGATCSLTTTANTLTPGTITDGKRTVFSPDQIQVMDGGADGLVSTADNDLFAVQGVFVP
jgi:Tol biopolymer transport system component